MQKVKKENKLSTFMEKKNNYLFIMNNSYLYFLLLYLIYFYLNK